MPSLKCANVTARATAALTSKKAFAAVADHASTMSCLAATRVMRLLHLANASFKTEWRGQQYEHNWESSPLPNCTMPKIVGALQHSLELEFVAPQIDERC